MPRYAHVFWDVLQGDSERASEKRDRHIYIPEAWLTAAGDKMGTSKRLVKGWQEDRKSG